MFPTVLTTGKSSLLLAALLVASGCVVEIDPADDSGWDEVQDLTRRTATTQVPTRSAQELADERQLLTLHNAARSQAGLQGLLLHHDLVDDARFHSDRMAAGTYCAAGASICHSQDLANFTTGWEKLGENVGLGPSVTSLHGAFMASPGHKANIMDASFNFAGVGFNVVASGKKYVTVVFMKKTAPFVDCVGNTHARNILAIWGAGITKGCNPPQNDRFCPGSAVTRGQMAAFLSRALELPAAAKDHFSDDTGAWYEQQANQLFEAKITVGCGGGRYCGQDRVTRGQMAAFLARALKLPAAAKDHFVDDNGAWYEQHANQLFEAKITVGCGGGRYCGAASVTRAQMASFLARALKL